MRADLAFFHANKRGDRWDSTKDTACVLYALCDYLAAVKAGPAATGQIKVNVNGKDDGSVQLDSPTSKVVKLTSKGLKPGENALLAGFAAGRGRSERRRGARRQMRQRFVIERAVAGMDGDPHGREWPACGERLERVDDQRAPGAVQILLRPVGAEPQAPAGGDDEKRDLNPRQLRAPAGGRDAFPAHLNRRQRGRAGTQS